VGASGRVFGSEVSRYDKAVPKGAGQRTPPSRATAAGAVLLPPRCWAMGWPCRTPSAPASPGWVAEAVSPDGAGWWVLQPMETSCTLFSVTPGVLLGLSLPPEMSYLAKTFPGWPDFLNSKSVSQGFQLCFIEYFPLIPHQQLFKASCVGRAGGGKPSCAAGGMWAGGLTHGLVAVRWMQCCVPGVAAVQVFP